jgi:hypothetical protein
MFVAILLPAGTPGSVAHAWWLIQVAATRWSRGTTKVRSGAASAGGTSTSANHSRSDRATFDRATFCALLLSTRPDSPPSAVAALT